MNLSCEEMKKIRALCTISNNKKNIRKIRAIWDFTIKFIIFRRIEEKRCAVQTLIDSMSYEKRKTLKEIAEELK